MLRLVNLVVEAVQHEVQQIRYNGFSAFRFQQFYQMVVCCRGKFNQDLADNADTGLFLVCDRDTVKFFHYFTAHFAEGEVVRKLFRGQEILALFYPLLMNRVDGAGLFFVGAHMINTAHENIAEDCTEGRTGQKVCIQFKSGVCLNAAHVDGNDRNVFHTGFFQCTADEADVVCCTAAAAGLGDNNRNLVQVIFTGKQGIHDLTDNTQGRIAGVVVDVF